MKQLRLLNPQKSDHGGILRSKRRGRGRRMDCDPLNMHFVLRSTQAKGPLRFQANRKKVASHSKKICGKIWGQNFKLWRSRQSHSSSSQICESACLQTLYPRLNKRDMQWRWTGASRWKKVNFKFWDLGLSRVLHKAEKTILRSRIISS